MKHTHVRGRVALVLAFCVVALGAEATADEQHLEGSWIVTVTATSPPGLPPFQGLMTFIRTGEVLESRRLYVPFTPVGPVLETSGHGAWVRTGNAAFDLAFMFLVQAAPNNPTFTQGEPLGTDNVRISITLDPSGESFAGSFVSQAKDNGGNVIFSATGTVAGTRIRP